MILFLTGAPSSLKKSDVAPQPDPQRSLGGYVSSSPVPNAALNELFDLVSTGMLNDRPVETIAIGLVNQLDKPVTDVRLSIVVSQKPICSWRVAATALSEDMRMESIPNRYAEPIGAEFYDATFQRACVDLEVVGEPLKDDQFLILPLALTVDVRENGLKGFWNGLKAACRQSAQYECERVSETVFRISYANETIAPEEGIECHVVKDSAADIRFLGKFINGATGEVLLIDADAQPKQKIVPGDGIGLWLQRFVSSDWEAPTDEELIEIKKRGEILQKSEKAEIIITYQEINE